LREAATLVLFIAVLMSDNWLMEYGQMSTAQIDRETIFLNAVEDQAAVVSETFQVLERRRGILNKMTHDQNFSGVDHFRGLVRSSEFLHFRAVRVLHLLRDQGGLA
jgi:hypothetical protein